MARSDIASTRAQRNAALEEELKEINAKPTTDGDDTDIVNQQEGGDPKSPATTGWEKRYADLRSHSAKRENELKKDIEQLKEQVNGLTKAEFKMPTTEEEFETWAKKYPDVVRMMKTIALTETKSIKEEIDSTRKTWEQEKKDREFQYAIDQVFGAHPDFAEIRETEEFQDWATAQPKWVREALYTEGSTDYESAIQAIDLYKYKTAPKKKDTRGEDDRRDAAKSTGRGGSKVTAPDVQKDKDKFYESDIEKMDIRTYSKNAEAIEKAMREGRVIFDVTGAAR